MFDINDHLTVVDDAFLFLRCELNRHHIVASLQGQLGDETGADHLIDLVDELRTVQDDEYAELTPYTLVAIGVGWFKC